MILILSQDTSESTTDLMIDWIEYFGGKFKRLNGVDVYKHLELEISNESVNLELINIDWDQINVVWFRRFWSSNNSNEILLNLTNRNEQLWRGINRYILNEITVLFEFFFKWIPKEKVYGRLDLNEINKLLVLQKARDLGLNIPQTIISRNSSNVTKKISSECITKAISEVPSIVSNGILYSGYTEDAKDVLAKKEKFGISLFQNKLEKKYEIRTFLLNNTFYSMAIISQLDEQTKVDFRVYNYDNPNRNCPYNLPKEVELKLLKLAKELKINTGSFDLVKTKNNEIVFLEVNPGGQFGMVSVPCNYYLEMNFAKELIKEDKIKI